MEEIPKGTSKGQDQHLDALREGLGEPGGPQVTEH